MSTLVLTGYVNHVKKYDNEDGSSRLLFSVSTKTHDSRRFNTNESRDFWSCNMYLPAKSKLGDYITDGKIVTVTGQPYITKDGDKQYVNVNVNHSQVELIGGASNGNSTANSASTNAAPVEQPVSTTWE